jgi:undecaprenyl-diphosphatase
MSVWISIVLGFVEGLTEFLPVSSTFHLVWAGRLLGQPGNEFTKVFDVVIQTGAILAIVILYWQRIRHDPVLVWKMMAAFLPTAVLGVLAYRTIKNVFFESQGAMVAIFLAIGVVFLAFEWLVRRGFIRPQKTLGDLTYPGAILIGLAQCLAFFPGVSRAGAVILAMMVLRFRRDEAATFSFLLAVPTIISAGGYDLYKSRSLLLASTSYAAPLIIGFVTAFVVALFAVKWFVRYLHSHSLNVFGIYRLIAGAVVLLVLLLA